MNVRFCRLMLMILASTGAGAAEPSSPKRIGAIVIPMDRRTEALTLKLEFFTLQALSEYPGLKPRPSDTLYPPTPDLEAQTALQRADQQVAAAQPLFQARQYEGAAKALTAALAEYRRAAPAMLSCGRLCDALAMSAASAQAMGHLDEAKLAVIELLALSPHFEPDIRNYPPPFFAFKAQVAAGTAARIKGHVTVKTRPPGARVRVDGELQGYAPYTAQNLAVGKHLLQIERPGFQTRGALVDVRPDDQDVSFDLTPSREYRAFDKQMDGLAAESAKARSGPAMSAIAASHQLDQAIFVVIRDKGESNDVLMSYFDLKSGTKLAARRTTFQGDEFGEMGGEVMRLVRQLLNATSGSGPAGDPLDRVQGTEGWNETGSHRTQEPQRGDPLDTKTGTENW